jgi:hypothetical protein
MVFTLKGQKKKYKIKSQIKPSEEILRRTKAVQSMYNKNCVNAKPVF